MDVLLIDNAPPRFADAEAVAKEWTTFFLDDRFRPPAALRYTALPRAGEHDCDRLRMRYQTDDLILTVTQSIGVFCLEVTKQGGTLEIEQLSGVERIARAVFNNGSTIELLSSASAPTAGTAHPDESGKLPWLKTMRWKKTRDGLAFLMLKDDGQPRMAAVGMTQATNEYWYSTPNRTDTAPLHKCP